MTNFQRITLVLGLSFLVSGCQTPSENTTEWMGYLASALVLSSFLFSKMTSLRIINMLGAVAFVTYGFMLDIAYPIVITNTAIFLIHTYHLIVNKSEKNA